MLTLMQQKLVYHFGVREKKTVLAHYCLSVEVTVVVVIIRWCSRRQRPTRKSFNRCTSDSVKPLNCLSGSISWRFVYCSGMLH